VASGSSLPIIGALLCHPQPTWRDVAFRSESGLAAPALTTASIERIAENTRKRVGWSGADEAVAAAADGLDQARRPAGGATR
jgi:hypothetical protein